MSSAGSIVLDGRTMTFAALSSPNSGRPLENASLVQESLAYPGIDFERWRQVALRYMPYKILGLSAFASYATALPLLRHFELRHHKLCSFAWALGGVNLRYNKVKIIDTPTFRVVPGYITGGGTSITGVATLVYSEFTLQHTEG